jgi:hypothetical protein
VTNLSTLLDPSRAAHASIRGYLYQAWLGVERWLNLRDDEVLRCEGDEDLDRLLRDGSGGWSEQVKVLSSGVTNQVVQKTLRQFAVSHHRLRTADPPEPRRFRFTSTATRSAAILEDWEKSKTDDTARARLIDELRKLLPFAKRGGRRLAGGARAWAGEASSGDR